MLADICYNSQATQMVVGVTGTRVMGGELTTVDDRQGNTQPMIAVSGVASTHGYCQSYINDV